MATPTPALESQSGEGTTNVPRSECSSGINHPTLSAECIAEVIVSVMEEYVPHSFSLPEPSKPWFNKTCSSKSTLLLSSNHLAKATRSATGGSSGSCPFAGVAASSSRPRPPPQRCPAATPPAAAPSRPYAAPRCPAATPPAAAPSRPQPPVCRPPPPGCPHGTSPRGTLQLALATGQQSLPVADAPPRNFCRPLQFPAVTWSPPTGLVPPPSTALHWGLLTFLIDSGADVSILPAPGVDRRLPPLLHIHAANVDIKGRKLLDPLTSVTTKGQVTHGDSTQISLVNADNQFSSLLKSFPTLTQPYSRQLKQFLGMLNYYNRFIPSCSLLLQPLYAMIKPCKRGQSISLVWTPATEEAFTAAKQALSSVSPLSFPAPDGLVLPCPPPPDYFMQHIKILRNYIFHALGGLNHRKNYGHDGVPAVLRNCASVLSPCLFNNDWSYGVLGIP
ncbi:nascent polypeptide-associated complex subunit alpha, muscle-specific form-like [Scylla paramamosain]|uniref:nascent polypeptide-associated complex subunit alpha, muscle-specific form-like n=1 Tax=Scylla paramamosain TaxID=85552 RepID=UPI003083D927